MDNGTLDFEDIPFAAQPVFFDEDEDTWILSEPYRGDNFYTTGSWTDKEGKKYTVESLTPAILTSEINKPGATSYTPTMTLPNDMCYTIMDTIEEEIWKIDAASGPKTFFQEFIGTDGSLYATEDRLKWLKYLLLGGPVNQQVWLYNDAEGESYVYTVDTIEPSDTLDEAGHPIAKTILPTDMCNTIMHTIETSIQLAGIQPHDVGLVILSGIWNPVIPFEKITRSLFPLAKYKTFEAIDLNLNSAVSKINYLHMITPIK